MANAKDWTIYHVKKYGREWVEENWRLHKDSCQRGVEKSTIQRYIRNVEDNHSTAYIDLIEFKEETLTAIAQHSFNYKPINYKNTHSDNLLMISLYDHHFGQLSWKAETGENYNIKEASKLFRETINYFIGESSHYKPSKILFVLGNDFFNVNSATNTTVAGTAQAEETRWQKTFITARIMMVDAIESMMGFAPVDVLTVPGNHDKERIFYLGEVVDAWFNKSKDVLINNSPEPFKTYKWGNWLGGFVHKPKRDTALRLASEFPKDWGQTKYHEVYTGHLHIEICKEYQKVRVYTLPSLVARDDWHTTEGYNHIRESQAVIINKNIGPIVKLSYRL